MLNMIENNVVIIGTFIGVALTSVFIAFCPNLSIESKKIKNQKIKGLENYGNNCFINVILQSLASCDCFIDWLNVSLQEQIDNSSLQITVQDDNLIILNPFYFFLKLIKKKVFFNTKQNTSETNLTYNLLTILQQLNKVEDLNSYSRRNLSPKQVLEILHKFNFPSSDIQQDAHELFNVMIASLEVEIFGNYSFNFLNNLLIEKKKLKESDKSIQTKTADLNKNSDDKSKNLNKIEPNLFQIQTDQNTFLNLKRSLPTNGLLANQLYCATCGHKFAASFEPFHCISLAIPNNLKVNHKVTLEDCLNKFVSNEILGSVKCEFCIQKCKTKIEKIKKKSLDRDANTKEEQQMDDEEEKIVCEEEKLNEIEEKKIKIMKKNYLFKKSIDTIEYNLQKENSIFIKRLTFAKMPKLLVIHIQRLNWLTNGMPIKRNDHIKFPEILVMDNYIYGNSTNDINNEYLSILKETKNNLIENVLHDSGSNLINQSNLNSSNISIQSEISRSNKNETILEENLDSIMLENKFIKAKYKYKLNANIVHLGNAFTGHYVNYRKSPEKVASTNQEKLSNKSFASNSWFFTSDTIVKTCKLKDVLSSSAYMLFYERIK